MSKSDPEELPHETATNEMAAYVAEMAAYVAPPTPAYLSVLIPAPELDTPPDWDQAPDLLTTKQVAAIIGKDVGNVRARTSKSEFGNVGKDDKGRNLYTKASVKSVYERVVKSRNALALHGVAGKRMDEDGEMLPASHALLAEKIRKPFEIEIAHWAARHGEVQSQNETLQKLLIEREETTREMLSEHTASYDARAREAEAHRVEIIAAKDAEIERLRGELGEAKKGATIWRKLFQWGN